MLKPSLEDFACNSASMGDECNCLDVWILFSTALLGNWDEDWHFPVMWPPLHFPNLLTYWVQHFSSIIFRSLISSAGIPSPPLTLLAAMLPKAPLTSHSKSHKSRPLYCCSFSLWVIDWWMSTDTSMKLFRLPSQSDDVRGIFSVHASLLQNDIPGTSFTFSLLPRSAIFFPHTRSCTCVGSSQMSQWVKDPSANAGDIRDTDSIPGWADALAVAICHAHANKLEKTLKNIGGTYV